MPGVQLRSLEYFERKGHPKEWTLDGLLLGPVNLIVGRNATGKSRTLNLIWNLARLLDPETKAHLDDAGFDALFDNNGEQLRYIVQIVEGKVISEQVIVDGDTKLDRSIGGKGEIYAQDEGKKLRFQAPEQELAAVVRRDSIQHGFLEPLYEWARAVRHYAFGGSLGKGCFGYLVAEAPEPNERDANQVVGIFRKAVKELGQKFVDVLIEDMAELHYDIDNVEVSVPQYVRIIGANVPGDLLAVGIREHGIDAVIAQNEISDGMFSALSLLIQVNYSQMSGRTNCILIDDIGEGLDFERSSRLIEILRRKAKQSSFQLVMTTNDQFVMNHVPLQEWSVLQRTGCHVRVRNVQNSKKEFEDFRFVGLSNFAFMEMDFINGRPPEGELIAHE